VQTSKNKLGDPTSILMNVMNVSILMNVQLVLWLLVPTLHWQEMCYYRKPVLRKLSFCQKERGGKGETTRKQELTCEQHTSWFPPPLAPPHF